MPYVLRRVELEMGGLGLNILSRGAICFWFLAGCTAEIQTRLHQSFPGQSARAGAKGTGEEGAGGFVRPTVGCCCQAEESPQCLVYLSEWYCASSPLHLSHPLSCPLSLCSCNGCLPHDQSHKYRHRTARGVVYSQYVLVHTNMSGFNLLLIFFSILHILYLHLCFAWRDAYSTKILYWQSKHWVSSSFRLEDPPQLLNDTL